MNRNKARIVYFSHGGGPLPILGDPGHAAMVEFMKRLPSMVGKPEAILVISAHWEENEAVLTGSPAPPMFYDYYGFPGEAYKITYPAPGNPELAERISDLLNVNGVRASVDRNRGFDHGLFIPLKLMFPAADIPSIQLSLLHSLSPSGHVAMGRALRGITEENILVIGSGFSFHNMRAFSWDALEKPDPENNAFQDWLTYVCTGNVSQAEREQLLEEWEKAPHARYCHPREEHLLPLHVCAGMADKPAEVVFDGHILGKRSIAFLW